MLRNFGIKLYHLENAHFSKTSTRRDSTSGYSLVFKQREQEKIKSLTKPSAHKIV